MTFVSSLMTHSPWFILMNFQYLECHHPWQWQPLEKSLEWWGGTFSIITNSFIFYDRQEGLPNMLHSPQSLNIASILPRLPLKANIQCPIFCMYTSFRAHHSANHDLLKVSSDQQTNNLSDGTLLNEVSDLVVCIHIFYILTSMKDSPPSSSAPSFSGVDASDTGYISAFSCPSSWVCSCHSDNSCTLRHYWSGNSAWLASHSQLSIERQSFLMPGALLPIITKENLLLH